MVFHAGDEEGGVKGKYSQPESFVKALQSFPKDTLFMELVNQIGIERIVFGTNFPWSDHQEDIAHIEKLLGDKPHMIFWENPKKILDLES